MNKEIKAQWLNALRSGEYGKGKSVLRTSCGTKYCCLGVLADLYGKSHNGVDWLMEFYETEDDTPYYTIISCNALPPSEIIEWAEIDNQDVVHSLMRTNDRSDDFDSVCKIIEKEL